MNISGGIVDLDQAIVHSEIVVPLTNWLGSFIDFIFSYFDVFIIIAFLFLIVGVMQGAFQNKKSKKTKSLDNK